MRPVAVILALAPAASSCEPDEQAPIPEETTDEPELAVAPRTGIIAGRVLTREGEGFAGLKLYTMGELPKAGYCAAISDESGAFRFEGVAEGWHSIYAQNTTGWSDEPRLQCEHVEADTTDLVLTLAETARVRGQVLDPSGKTLASFRVEVITDETEPVLGTIVAQKTIQESRDGVFELGGLPAGAHRVLARAEGFAPSFSEPFRTEQGSVVESVVVRMTEGGSIAGLVLDARSDAAIAGAEVFLLELSWRWHADRTGPGTERVCIPRWSVPPVPAHTDGSGRFAFARLARGPYRLRIQAAGYAIAVTEEMRVEEGKTTELPSWVLMRGATITGVVQGFGGTGSGADVTLSPVNSKDLLDHRSAKAGASGRFALMNVSPGSYRICAIQAGHSQDPFKAIEDVRQSEIELEAVDERTHEFELRLSDGRR